MAQGEAAWEGGVARAQGGRWSEVARPKDTVVRTFPGGKTLTLGQYEYRDRQIHFGKESKEYKALQRPPPPPNRFDSCPNRAWDRKCRKWRQLVLNLYHAARQTTPNQPPLTIPQQ